MLYNLTIKLYFTQNFHSDILCLLPSSVLGGQCVDTEVPPGAGFDDQRRADGCRLHLSLRRQCSSISAPGDLRGRLARHIGNDTDDAASVDHHPLLY